MKNASKSFVGGASAPMLSAPIASANRFRRFKAIGAKSIGAEAPPTKDFDACAMPDSQGIGLFRSWRPGHA
ncbi:DUF6053 domain-containing protein [Lysobacter sp. TAB13]|uniref:DUF6053 domain-containing protein n=1 Tax=Lysobacter sp. TAB13 TaxID=3233065 RepID=UPI003F9C1552